MSEIDPRADTPLLNWSDLGVSELPTGTVTLLLADVEGSMRLWQTQPEEMAASVALLDHTVSDLVAAHGGVRPIEQGEGDSFVLAFARASDTMVCALELQRASLAPIRLRIGVHTGQVQLETKPTTPVRPSTGRRGSAIACERGPVATPRCARHTVVTEPRIRGDRTGAHRKSSGCLPGGGPDDRTGGVTAGRERLFTSPR